MGGMFVTKSDRDWWVLTRPPGPGWRLGSREAVHLEEGNWRDLLFLLNQEDRLKQLMVTTSLDDISGINQLHTLERLILFPSGKTSGVLDLGNLPHLRELLVLGSVPIEVPSGHSLGWLQVERLQGEFAESLSKLAHLDVLRLLAPLRIPEDYPASLRHLDITNVTHWDKVVGVLRGLESLRELYLTDIRGMRDLQSFSLVSRLDRLYAEDCEELSSLDGVVLTPETQYLFVGRTPLRRTMPGRWQIPEE